MTLPKGFLRVIMSLMLGVATGLAAAPGSAQEIGIGGGATFPNGAEFPFIAGIESSITTSFFIQNIGSRDIDLTLSHGAPRGITIEPVESQDTFFEAGESDNFVFEIKVDETVPPGSYRTIVNVRESEVERPEDGGSVYIPAIAGEFVIDVIGASAFASLNTVSALTGEPAVGNLSLFYLGTSGLEVLIEEVRGSQIETDLVPGNYRFTFDVPNLQRQDYEFSIGEDETLEYFLEIPTIEFLGVGAIPTRDDRDVIQLVSLSMDVYNNLQPIEGPVDFIARISRNGEFVEDFVIGTIPILPEAGTLLRATYDREDGFEQGDWTYQFIISNDDFELASEQVAVVSSPGLLQSYIQEIIIGLAALVIIGLLLPKRWWAIILRRRKKDEDGDITAEAPTPKVQASRIRVSWMKVLDLIPDVKIKPASKTLKQRAEKPLETSKTQAKSTSDAVIGKNSAWPSTSKASEETLKDKTKAGDSWISLALKRKTKDPLEEVLMIRREIEQLESNGARSLAFSYKLDSVFAKPGESVLNRVTGQPYGADDIEIINKYEELRESLQKVETPELKRQATKILIRERFSSGARG